MRFEISHLLHYRYSRPVFVEPHVVRLRPRSGLYQSAERFDLDIRPEPAGSTGLEDADGNLVTKLWFDGTIGELRIVARAAVRTLVANPFDYVVLDPDALRIPMTYDAPSIERYLRRPRSRAVRDFAAGMIKGDAQLFVGDLAERIHSEFVYETRDTGDPHPSRVTLGRRKGACRDLAVLFVDCCRAAGIAARFVSGYHEGSPDEERHLHAWAEVFLAEAGWRGYDPTFGLAVADRHVALAVAPSPEGASPVQGSFRGTGAESSLETSIELKISS